MNLIYYYPTDKGSPSNVAREILEELIKHADILPFNEIILFSKKKDLDIIKEKFQNLRVISYKELNELSEDYVVHFPVLPFILPNSKFLLYFHTKLIKRKKIIIQYHGDVRTELKSSYRDIRSLVHILSYIFLPKLLKSADAVITHSYSMNKKLIKYGVSRSVVIPNAIDSYWFQPNYETVNLKNPVDKNAFNVFYHGRLSWEKGIDILLEAAESCIKKNQNTMIYLAGEGSQKKQLKDICFRLKISSNVIFLGSLNKEEIKEFLKNVDLAIYPSRFDNFPLAVLEALTCANCPVYFSKNVGIYDFAIKNGFPLNYFELNTKKISEILNSFPKKKVDIHYQMEFAKSCSWDLITPKYIEVYNLILDRQ
ncbi:Glycosyltransferase [Methanosarcina siciliae T4/M]|uniref:Glycosyltransferase n=1 Tax=Methanosarcina siciliae T4/M TaxID=1434120 RepID=A0A0E3P7A4_9EURY|nr:glycosyltransferase family 4 protein [Methanosarcina siciliae]AKB29738.1 Glycosyltransferase [Methanosarcina siciliae T4/M]